MSSLFGEAWTPISLNPAIDFHEPFMNNGEIICALEIRSEAYLGTERQLRHIRIAISLTIDTTTSQHQTIPTELRRYHFCHEIVENVHGRGFVSLGAISDHVAKFLEKEWPCKTLTINVGAVSKDPKALLGTGCQRVLQGGMLSDGSTIYRTLHPSSHMWSIRSLEASCIIGSNPDGQAVMPKMKIDLRFWSKAGDQTFPEFTDKQENWQRLSQGVCDIVAKVGFTELEKLEELATEMIRFMFTKCPLFRVSCRLQLPLSLSMASVGGSLEVEISRNRDTMGIEYEAGSSNSSQDSYEVDFGPCG
ncbi:MAG: hypothetical protein OHK93_004782 [Ramalina farinacea]|uniref:Dihydroneopterin aldolase/epimerase domain-containing protein n=1 Tax=Ramalina farinacea TaxID=258253 RepID=A0AA43QY08_9LECA|nr:hypothetical protein [Ramalina farinacea]